MTFEELQDAVMTPLNLTSSEARARVKVWLNLRYREVQSSLNLARTRRGSTTISTVSGQDTVVVSGVAKLFGLYDDEVLHAPLVEEGLDEILTRQTSATVVAPPRLYAIDQHVNDDVVVRLYPTPDATRELLGDALLAGTDMEDDDDEPTIPVDFHDVLVHGAMADEYTKMDKARSAAMKEAKFEKRLGELRLFLAKTAKRDQSPVPQPVAPATPLMAEG